MTDTPTRKDKGKAMKPPADATHCGGYPIDTPTPDTIPPPLDEVFDTQREVEKNPCGAWQAIQALSAKLEAAEAERDALSRALSYFLVTDPDNPGRWEYNREFAERMANKQLEKIARAALGKGEG